MPSACALRGWDPVPTAVLQLRNLECEAGSEGQAADGKALWMAALCDCPPSQHGSPNAGPC